MSFYCKLIVSSLLSAAPLVSGEVVEPVKTEIKIQMNYFDKELLDHAESTSQTLVHYSKNNRDVLRMNQNFTAELERAYSEGLISKIDVARILTAVSYAAEKHENQIRKDVKKTPYIIHPIGVAYNVMTIGQVHDADIIIAALLHDTVEDTTATFEEIHALFGERVENYVREVTDDRSLPQAERKLAQIEHAPDKSPGATQIKLADKLYNLNDLFKKPPADWSAERVDLYFTWGAEVVNRLPSVEGHLKAELDHLIEAYWAK